MSTPRRPVRLLDIAEKASAYPRELLADFTSGALTLVNESGTEVKVFKPIKFTDAGNTEIATIEGNVEETVVIPTGTTSKFGLLKLSSTAPKAAGTASAGTGTTAAKSDHVHPKQEDVGKLTNARNIAMSGVTATPASFDGSQDVTIAVTEVPASLVKGVLSIDNIPNAAIERLKVVANETARFALTTADVQKGDTVKENDTGLMYYVVDDTKLSSAAGYEAYTAGAASSVDWSGITNIPDSVTNPTQLSKGTTTGSGNAVTDISVDGHKITLTKGSTFLTAHPTISKSTDDSDTAKPAHGGDFTAISAVTRDANGHVTKVTTKTVTLPGETSLSKGTTTGGGNAVTDISVSGHQITLTKGSTFLTAHPGVTKSDDSSSTGAPKHGESFTAIDSVTRDTNGHVTKVNTKTVTLPSETGLSKGTTTGSGNAVTDITVSGHQITLTKNSTFLTAHPSVSVGTDTTSTGAPGYGGTFTTIDGVTRDANGHVTKVNTKTVTLPALSHPTISKSTDADSSASPAHGGTFTAVDTVTRDTNGHVTKVTTKTVTLPGETDLSKGTTSGSGNAVTDIAVSGHQITLTKGSTFLTAHPTVSVSADTSDSPAPGYGGTFQAVKSITKDANGHITKVTTSTITMPSQQTTITGNAGSATKLANSRNFSITGGATATAVGFTGEGNVALNVTSLDATKLTGVVPLASIPAAAVERVKVVADDTARFKLTTSDVQNGDVVKVTSTNKMYFVVDDTKLTSADGYMDFAAGVAAAAESVPWSGITGIPDSVTNPTQLSKGTTSGSGNAVTDISVSGHQITLTKGSTFLTAHPNVTVSESTTSTAAPAHAKTFTAIDGITRDGNGHVTGFNTKTVTLPTETGLSKGTTSGSGNAVTDISVSGHQITLTKGSTFLTAHPTISKSTDSTSTAAPAHGGTFTAVDSITRDSNGHVTKVNTKTITLPGDNNTDTKVSVAVDSGSTALPLLLATGSSAYTGTAKMDTGVTLVPSTNTISANISGNAATATMLESRYIHKGYTNTATYYFPLADLPIDNSGNSCSIIVNGRIGGWTNNNVSKLDLVMTNRSNDYSGEEITASGSIKGSVTGALGICDIVVYKQTDLSATVYLKCVGYYTFDITVDYYQATSSWTGSYSTTTPTGTMVWSLSGFDGLVRVNTAGNMKAKIQWDYVTNKPTFATVATSGSYNDLEDKPTIPTVPSITANTTGSGNAITSVSASGHTLTFTKGTTFLTSATDTKNTAGSTNTSSKIFLIGATSQAANPQTYSHDTAYVGTDGLLYSGGNKVLTSETSLSKAADSGSGNTVTEVAVSGHQITLTKARRAVSATQTATVLGTSKTTEKIGEHQLVFSSGAIFSGTAQNAGLVTRGICGVSTPDASGACSKDNLYINYDGADTYSNSRHLILQAESAGSDLGGGLYTYAAARGDKVKAFVESKGYITSSGQTALSKGTTSGSGNAVTDISVSGHTITLTKGSTFLTSQTQLSKTDSGSGNAVTGISVSNHAITVTKGTTFATTTTYTASVTTTWSGSAAPYSQTITVSGITASDNPVVDVVLSSTYATAQTQLEDFAKIYRITTAANSITVYATEKTTTALSIQLKCVR